MSHIWMRQVTLMNASCCTYECVMSDIWMRRCHTCEWVISHTWISHVRHMNVSCHTHECVMSHTWMRHVAHANASCHTIESSKSHICTSRVTHMVKSCHVMSHIWISSINGVHVTRMDKSWHTYEWFIPWICIRHITRTNESGHLQQETRRLLKK